MFRDPAAPKKILAGITEFMEREGVRSVSELIGAANC
jgi:dihydroorotate dehydrogenase